MSIPSVRMAGMEQLEVYLLAVVEPYFSPRHPVPIDTIVVHARTLLHRDVPQPDGGNIYRCLTAFPGRKAGEIVPIATITAELGGGRNWRNIGHWDQVVAALARLTASRRCDSLEVALPADQQQLVMNAPRPHVFHWRNGRFGPNDGPSTSTAGPADRRSVLAGLEQSVQAFVNEGGPFWPGEPLLAPPPYPPAEVYAPVDVSNITHTITFYVDHQ